jgi:serine/threonine-protein kinase/endoribonuclease IRE1
MARKSLLLALFGFALAQQQHVQQHPQRQGSPREGLELKQTISSILPTGTDHDYKRAIATFAPAAEQQAAAVRAFPHGLESVTVSPREFAGGVTGSSRARNIQDWEVENLVLLATVDGSIHARDRKTGQDLWKFDTENGEMVETKHFAGARSKDGRQDFMWIIEPNQGGNIYKFQSGPRASLQKLRLTVQDLAEHFSPWASDDDPYVFTAIKKTTLITLNATNGVALKYFSDSGGGGRLDNQGCHTIKGLGMDEDNECEPTPVINLAKTEYSVNILDKDTTLPVCTLKYSEWKPNRRDSDLQEQYKKTIDNKYIFSAYDGSISAFELADEQEHNRFLYRKQLGSPVARVFDVARPQGSDRRDASLVVLEQPIAPNVGSSHARDVFVNHTDSGNWYALSEFNYPSVTDGAKEAMCYDAGVRERLLLDDDADPTNDIETSNYLVGVHKLPDYTDFVLHHSRGSYLGLDGPNQSAPTQAADSRSKATAIPAMPGDDNGYRRTIDGPTPQPRIDSFPQTGMQRFFRKMSLQDYVMYAVIFLLVYQTYGQKLGLPGFRNSKLLKEETSKTTVDEPEKPLEPAKDDKTKESDQPKPLDQKEMIPEIRVVADGEDLVEVISGVSAEGENADGDVEDDDGLPALDDDVDSETPKRKKAHRGKRGQGRKKKAQAARKQAAMDNPITPVVIAQADGPATLQTRVSDVANSLELSGLQVSDKILGRGSGGTMVFEGKFGKIDVAIKRMLHSYVQVASQEVELLQQSDHHKSIIRYYHQVEDKDFLYIAVERCQASLNDLFGEPRANEIHSSTVADEVKGDLALKIGQSVPLALRQLASGLAHLHDLRIIHRDLKPHNILVAYPRKNEKDTRLVISDFGLCRLLPEEASTLATTIGNAGTLGWKAPEIIGNEKIDLSSNLNEHSSHALAQDPDASVYSVNDGTGGNLPGTNSTPGKVKRAVDIFSLGCVFFFVMTGGSHPFDSKVTEIFGFERQFNIKRNIVNLDPLTNLGPESEEPVHLIRSMIAPNPRHRPTAKQVLHHPFFWTPTERLHFLCDVSDHFEREERDPPSPHLQILESICSKIHGGDFLGKLDHKFVETLGKQRKYTGDRMLDLLRALRNKKNHYDDMPEDVKQRVGPLPAGYLQWWSRRFPGLIIACYEVVLRCGLEQEARFVPYFENGER